jgi:hypothetical protein
LSVDVLLLILRVIAGLLLLAIMGAVFWVVWRDYRAAAHVVDQSSRQRGRLVVIEMGASGATSDAGEDQATTELTGSPEALEAAHLVGASFPLLPLTTLGRAPTNTIVLNDTFCSQDHARLTWRGGQWWLEDRDSSNGTRLNGEPVREPVVVSSGDVIGVGRIALKVELSQG